VLQAAEPLHEAAKFGTEDPNIVRGAEPIIERAAVLNLDCQAEVAPRIIDFQQAKPAPTLPVKR
jgi:hypothetical protein